MTLWRTYSSCSTDEETEAEDIEQLAQTHPDYKGEKEDSHPALGSHASATALSRPACG